MSDEIIKQGPGFTIYRTTEWGPPVPYPAMPREDSMNYGFMDLRDHPERVEHIPEAQQSAGLQQILRVLNRVGSSLMSLGCEYRLNSKDDARDGYACYFHSYTDLTYRDPVSNSSEDQLIGLAERFLREIVPREDTVFGFELGIQRMKGFFGARVAYNLSLGISGYGRTEEEASRSYEAGVQASAAALAKIC
jgi:hypothetical protein